MAIQVLYQIDMAQSDIGEALRLFCEHFKAPDSIRDFAVELANGVHKYREEIDTLISRFSENWRLERMSDWPYLNSFTVRTSRPRFP